jgi:coenzyme F420-reducing hydrogenase gamma subunit
MDRAEIYLNETLRELRAITERIPYDARLSGTPKLTEEIAHLLDKYLEQRAELAQLKTELQRVTIHDKL